jgi:hypothetical protein
MLAAIGRYLPMPAEDRLLFRLGRRGGGLRSLDELNDPRIRQRLQFAVKDLAADAGGDVPELIRELADQYI